MFQNNNTDLYDISFKLKNKYIFICIFLFLQISLFCFNSYSSNIINPQTPTTKKPHGVKVEGAQYYDELWDKYNVIAIEGEGGGGNGGGKAGSGTTGSQGSGVINGSNNSNGSVGNNGILGGTNGSSKNYNVQSNKELKESRAQAEKEKQESIAKELETAKNYNAVKQSIEQRESIQESIQKKIIQESIKAKVLGENYIPTPTTNYNIIPSNDLSVFTTPYTEPQIIPSMTQIETTTIVPEEQTEILSSQYNQIESINNIENINPTIESIEDNKETTKEQTDISNVESNENNLGGDGGVDDSINKSDFNNTSNFEKKDIDSSNGKDIIRDIEGENKGIKIFEINRNGNVGIFDKGGSRTYLLNILLVLSVILFIYGFIKYFINSIMYKHEYKGYFI